MGRGQHIKVCNLFKNTNLGNLVGSFFRKKVSQAYDINNFPKEDKENRNRCTMNACPNRSNGHQDIIIEVSKGEKLEQWNLFSSWSTFWHNWIKKKKASLSIWASAIGIKQISWVVARAKWIVSYNKIVEIINKYILSF